MTSHALRRAYRPHQRVRPDVSAARGLRSTRGGFRTSDLFRTCPRLLLLRRRRDRVDPWRSVPSLSPNPEGHHRGDNAPHDEHDIGNHERASPTPNRLEEAQPAASLAATGHHVGSCFDLMVTSSRAAAPAHPAVRGYSFSLGSVISRGWSMLKRGATLTSADEPTDRLPCQPAIAAPRPKQATVLDRCSQGTPGQDSAAGTGNCPALPGHRPCRAGQSAATSVAGLAAFHAKRPSVAPDDQRQGQCARVKGSAA